MLRLSRLDMAVWSTITTEQEQKMYTTQDRTKRWTLIQPNGSLDSGQEVDLVRRKLLPPSKNYSKTILCRNIIININIINIMTI